MDLDHDRWRRRLPEIREEVNDLGIPELSETLDYLWAYPWSPAQIHGGPSGLDWLTWPLIPERKLASLLADGELFQQGHPPSTEVLVPFTPYREDQEPFVFPVLERLTAQGIHTTLLLPRTAPGRAVQRAPNGVEVLREHELADWRTYRSTRRNQTGIRSRLDRLAEVVPLDRGRRARTRKLFARFYWQRALFDRLLTNADPDLVYGLYVGTARPGYLAALRDRPTDERPELVLLQHGVITPRSPPDFRGADRILAWGTHQARFLKRWSLIDPPPIEIVGNPKVDQLRGRVPPPSLEDDQDLTVLFISNPDIVQGEDVNRRALEIFNEAAKSANGWTPRYRPHPFESLDKFPPDPGSNRIDRSKLPDALETADVVIGRESTALLEAVATGRPAIQVDVEADSGSSSANSLEAWKSLEIERIDDAETLQARLEELSSQPEAYRALVEQQEACLEQVFGDPSRSIEEITRHLQTEIHGDQATVAERA